MKSTQLYYNLKLQFHFPSKLRFFCTNLNFGLFFFWYFFFQLKRVYSKTALFILIQFFFLKYHEYKNASLVFSLSYLLSELFFLFNVFFSQLFIFKATIFIFISTWLILIFHHFLFINFIRTIFSCFFCLIFYV